MYTPESPSSPARRVARAVWKALSLALRLFFVLLLVVIPVPILFRFKPEKPAPRNLPTQVKPRE